MRVHSILLLSLLFAHGISEAGSPREGGPERAEPSSREFQNIHGVAYQVVDDQKEWINRLYSERDFGALEKHITGLLNRLAHDGTSYELYLLYNRLGRVGNKVALRRRLEVLDDWCRQSSASHIPWLVRGAFHVDHAWHVRGGAWAKDTPKHVWPEFHRLLGLAQTDLEKAAEIDPGDPNAHAELITVAKGQSSPRSRMESYFRKGTAVHPLDYASHFLKFHYLTPNWGGTKADMFRFARECLAKADRSPYLGFILVYALDEDHKYDEQHRNILGAEENWPTIESIYARFFKKFPDRVRRRFFYAYHAFKAKKYEVALQQFEIIGDRWTEDTPWRSLEKFNECRASALYRKGHHLVWVQKVYDEAIHYLEESVRCLPSADAFYSLGIAYWQTGHEQRKVGLLLKAEESLGSAVQLEPGHTEARRQLNELRRQFDLYGR